MRPFRVSIEQMRGTTDSSRTLFKATNTASISKSQSRRPSKDPFRSSLHWSLSLVLALILLNIYTGDAQRLEGETRDVNINKKNYYPNYPPPVQGRRNGAVMQEKSDSNVNHDLDQFYVDEKEEDVKTIRFTNRKKPHDSSNGKRRENHHSHHQHDSSKSNSDDNDIDTQKNEIHSQRNQVKQRKEGNGEWSNNADSATFEEIEIPLEPLKKGDGLDPRELKRFIEDVAESILAEADRLYGIIESGSGVGFGDATSALQLSSSFDVGNYIICQ